MAMIGLVAAAAIAGPPAVFGIAVGQPLALPECPRSETGHYDLIAAPNDCWSKGDADQGGAEVWLAAATQAHAPFARVPIWVGIRDGIVQKVTIRTTGIASQEAVAHALVAKFGPPTTRALDRLQNRMGAHFASARASWRKPNVIVEFDASESDLDDGAVEIMTPAEAARDREQRRANAPHF